MGALWNGSKVDPGGGLQARVLAFTELRVETRIMIIIIIIILNDLVNSYVRVSKGCPWPT